MIPVVTNKRKQEGFTLIECMIAMVVTTVGLLGVAGLIAVGVRMQVESRDAISATAAAQSKLEELQNFSPTSSQRARGGSLTSNVNNYSDVPDPRFQRRWKIETNPADAGVPPGTQRITVSILSNSASVRIPPINVATLMKTE